MLTAALLLRGGAGWARLPTEPEEEGWGVEPEEEEEELEVLTATGVEGCETGVGGA